MIGKRYENLVVVNVLKGSFVECLCDCGSKKIIRKGHFNAGYYKSCGCHSERHGHWKNNNRSREYVSWGNMIARCHNKKNKRYKDYGGKGIHVCDRWRKSFKSFYEDLGDCPDGFQIDRINNLIGYFPGNCRWVSPKNNMANRNKTMIYVIGNEKFESCSDAAKRFGVSESTISAWCVGRKTRDYLAKKKTYVERFYKPKEGCGVEHIYSNSCA